MMGLRKDPSNGMLADVCSGIANFFDISPLAIRLIFIVTGAIFVYLILALLLPVD